MAATTVDRHLFAVDGEPVTAAAVNARLAELAGEHVTAEDFRTSLAVNAHLIR